MNTPLKHTLVWAAVGLIILLVSLQIADTPVVGIDGKGPDFVIPGDLLYRPYLDCQGLGGVVILELEKKRELYHIKTLCGTGIIFNYVYTGAGEASNLGPAAAKDIFEAGGGEVI